MKRVGLFLFVTALSCLLSAYDAAAQVTDVTNLRNITSLSSSGEWAGGKLTRNVSVQLTGDVTLKAPIVIPSGRAQNFFLSDISFSLLKRLLEQSKFLLLKESFFTAYFVPFSPYHYSYLKASIGSIFAALLAG